METVEVNIIVVIHDIDIIIIVPANLTSNFILTFGIAFELK